MFSKIKKILKLLIYTFILLTFTLFMFNNTDFVKINLFPFAYGIEIRLFLLITLSFIFGILFSGILNIIKDSFGIKSLKQYIRIKKIEKEIKELKDINKQI